MRKLSCRRIRFRRADAGPLRLGHRGRCTDRARPGACVAAVLSRRLEHSSIPRARPHRLTRLRGAGVWRMKESSFASAVRLIEDALVLAKRADATAWLVYLAGVVPFFGFLLYEITDLAQNPFALDRLVGTAFVAAVLYCWLHIGQSVFCGCLRATLTETAPALRACFAEAAAAQPILAAGKLMIWPVTLLLVVPHPAVTMFFQHSLVPSASRPQGVRSVMAESRRNALYRSWQAIWMLLLVLLLRAILWVNLFGLLVMAPALWKSFTGMEGRLTRSPDLLLNPTSLAALAMLAYIGLDPPVKAACVLRQFTRGAEESGLDLR